jgi:hypothetical protein
MYSYVCKSVSSLFTKVNKIYEYICTPVLYGFYHGYDQPVPYRVTNVSKPYLFYDTERKIFFSDYNTIDTIYSLPLLSIEILDINNSILYDLTNFIEDIRFAGTTAPSISSIIMVWSTLNSIYLNPKFHEVRYIDAMGDIHESDFFNCTELKRDE